MDVLKIIGEIGSIGLLAVVLYFVYRYIGGISDRLMNNLETQTRNNELAIRAQEQVTQEIRLFSQRLDDHEEQVKSAAECREEIVVALKELTGVVRGLNQQMQSHEGRAQARHEQLQQRDHEFLAMLQSVTNGSGHS